MLRSSCSIAWTLRLARKYEMAIRERSINRRHVYAIWERDLSIAGMYIRSLAIPHHNLIAREVRHAALLGFGESTR